MGSRGILVGGIAALLLGPWVSVASAQAPGSIPNAIDQLRDLQQLQQLTPPTRAPLTVTPTLTVTEEFNDNVLLNNDNKEWDFITGLTPGIHVLLERPTYRFLGAYNFTADIYARDADRNRAFDRQHLLLDGSYGVTPEITLSLSDSLTAGLDTNLIATENVSAGRDESLGNVLTGGVTWRAARATIVRLFGSYTLQRFESDDLEDSDVYRAEIAVEQGLTRRLSGLIGYQFAYFDIENEPQVTSHTPRIGALFRFSETLVGSLSGGPSFQLVEGGDTIVTPAITASLQKTFRWGSIGAQYNRLIGTAGGLGGTTDNEFAGLLVQATTLMKGLVVEGGPYYTSAQSDDDRIDVRTFSIGVRAAYQITPWLAAVGSYTFFQQRSDSTLLRSNGTPIAHDADQNRVLIGLQFAYPIKID